MAGTEIINSRFLGLSVCEVALNSAMPDTAFVMVTENVSFVKRELALALVRWTLEMPGEDTAAMAYIERDGTDFGISSGILAGLVRV